MDIILPVSRISRKILIHDYQAEPIAPRPRDLLYHQLCYGRFPNLQWNRYFKILNSEIKLILPKTYFGQHHAQLFQAGFMLYTSHLDMMLKWVEAQTFITGNAWGAIEAFYQKYDIDEDDFSIESAYKRWQRYQDGLHYDVRDDERLSATATDWHIRVPFTREMCADLAGWIQATLHRRMYLYTGTFDLVLARAIEVWVLQEYGQMSGPKAAEAMGLPVWTAWRARKKVAAWVEAEGLADTIAALATSVRAAA